MLPPDGPGPSGPRTYDRLVDRRSPASLDVRRLLDLSTAARYLTAALVVLAGTGIREALLPGVGETSPFLAAILPVLVASLVGGFGPGVLGIILTAVLAAVLYLPPVGHVAVHDTGDLLVTGGFVLEGLAVAAIGAVARRSLLAREPLASASEHLLVLLRIQHAAGVLASDAALVEPLSERELEVMHLVALGLRNDEIASTLFVSSNTVKTHLAHAYAKLGVRSRTEAVARCAALGLLDRSPAPPGDRGRPAG